MSSPRSGKGGRVLIGATPCALKEWTVDDAGEDLDGTSFEDNGMGTGTIGIEELSFTIRGDWQFDVNFMDDDPPGLFPRDDLADVELQLNAAGGIQYDIPVVRVISCRTGTPVRGLVSFEATCKSNGGYSRPTGTLE